MNAKDDELGQLLRSAIRPVPDVELSQDLWPRMLTRMHRTGRLWSSWDWAAVAAGGTVAAAFPEAFSLLFYAL